MVTSRWTAHVDGPLTPEDAALLPLALSGYDEKKAIKAIYHNTA
jgi:hypothetical protein